jgi:large subunit ribosomal protein L3
MKFTLGTKSNMSEVFAADGTVTPVTILKVGPLTVTQVKNSEKDGYKAIQLGFGTKNERNIAKPQKGHFKGLGAFRFVREYRLQDADAIPAVGDKFDMTVFKEGDIVAVSATSKGKGFQGTVRRHHFKGGSRTHGQKHSEREPGAIGGGARAGGRVAKGMRMSGRMGGDRITVKNLQIVALDMEKGELYIKGAVPGVKGGLVEVHG